MLSTLGWFALAWIVQITADWTGFWQLCFASVIFAGWGLTQDVSKEGYFHPLLVFSVFSLLVTLINLGWMAESMNSILLFFSYKFPVDADSVVTLSQEQTVLLTTVYTAYLLIGGVGRRKAVSVRLVPRIGSTERMWLAFYALGIFALLALIITSGGFTQLFENLGAKYERAAGRGVLVALVYFAAVGALFWYKKNIAKPARYRYGGLALLATPFLLTGSRSWLLIILIAALYVDERIGRRISLKAIALTGTTIAVLFALYQAFRGGQEVDILLSLFKDLSVGTGYLIALERGIAGTQIHPGAIFVALAPIASLLPYLGLQLPLSPNYVFTQSLFPGTQSTFSMGVMGEASYLFDPEGRIAYYFFIGSFLTWVGSRERKTSLLWVAIVSGVSYRIVRGGLTQGMAELLLFSFPLLCGYLLNSAMTRKVLSLRGTRNSEL